MNSKIKNKLLAQFSSQDQADALSEMESITLQHVMAKSQTNLDNTLLAILELSKGNLTELESLVKAAKKDFRDVIYWASLEKNK